MAAGARLMIYDRTCRGAPLRPGLTHAWWLGGHLYRALGRLDAWRGVASWAEGLDWLLAAAPGQPIAEIQFWGHGERGVAFIDEDRLDLAALRPGHVAHARLVALRERLVPDGAALWWFRTCDTFGTDVGHTFARAWTRLLGCRAAGHTHAIDFWQSGLHVLSPGAAPAWSVDEGVVDGAHLGRPSSPRAPHTITCLHGRIPRGWS